MKPENIILLIILCFFSISCTFTDFLWNKHYECMPRVASCEKRREKRLCAKFAHGDVTLNSNAVVTCLCKSSYFKDELMSLSFCFQVF